MRKTTVTGHSDVFPLWSGLISAISDLHNQVRTSATLPVPLLALLYLSCISGLHITTPALFGVEVFSVNELVPVNTHGWLNWTETREYVELLCSHTCPDLSAAEIGINFCF